MAFLSKLLVFYLIYRVVKFFLKLAILHFSDKLEEGVKSGGVFQGPGTKAKGEKKFKQENIVEAEYKVVSESDSPNP